jgi:hypothetical protein
MEILINKKFSNAIKECNKKCLSFIYLSLTLLEASSDNIRKTFSERIENGILSNRHVSPHVYETK